MEYLQFHSSSLHHFSYVNYRSNSDTLPSEYLLNTKPRPNRTEDILEIGLELENIIVAANHATQGLIATFFIGMVVCLVSVFFAIVSTLGLNDTATGYLKVIHATGGIIEATMFLFRFYRLMNSGDRLWKNVKQSRRTFENKIILNEGIEIKDNVKQKSYVLQKRLDVYQYVSPISPYAVFGLCSKTFFATLATVISYVVILIKLRGVDEQHGTITSRAVNETIAL